jgi:hypothetical protein
MSRRSGLLVVISLLGIPGMSCAKGAPPEQLDGTMRAVRLYKTLRDPSGNPARYVSWKQGGEFKEVTEQRFVPVEKEAGEKVSMMMFRPLLIPNAPWMMIRGKIYVAARPEARAVQIGEEAFHPLNLPDQKPMTSMMWKTTETNGKWIGVIDGKVYAADEDGTGAQIGLLAYRSLTIETGETVLLFMTKGMVKGAVWEGDVGDTEYREVSEGKGKAVAKLAYRPFKLADGTETVLLMSHPLGNGGAWTGAWDGKVITVKGPP